LTTRRSKQLTLSYTPQFRLFSGGNAVLSVDGGGLAAQPEISCEAQNGFSDRISANITATPLPWDDLIPDKGQFR
jgi:hypothetical protein